MYTKSGSDCIICSNINQITSTGLRQYDILIKNKPNFFYQSQDAPVHKKII